MKEKDNNNDDDGSRAVKKTRTAAKVMPVVATNSDTRNNRIYCCRDYGSKDLETNQRIWEQR